MNAEQLSKVGSDLVRRCGTRDPFQIANALGINVMDDCENLGSLKGMYRRTVGMKISYKKLWILLIEKDVSPATLRKDLNIATGTMTKMRRNEEVALSVLLRICEYLNCNIGDICDAVREENE